jgi:hypothetical protein
MHDPENDNIQRKMDLILLGGLCHTDGGKAAYTRAQFTKDLELFLEAPVCQGAVSAAWDRATRGRHDRVLPAAWLRQMAAERLVTQWEVQEVWDVLVEAGEFRTGGACNPSIVIHDGASYWLKLTGSVFDMIAAETILQIGAQTNGLSDTRHQVRFCAGDLVRGRERDGEHGVEHHAAD